MIGGKLPVDLALSEEGKATSRRACCNQPRDHRALVIIEMRGESLLESDRLLDQHRQRVLPQLAPDLVE